MRRTLARAAVPAATAALLLAGCTGGTSDDSTEGTSDGGSVLTIGATLDMYGWDPANQPGFQNWAADAVWSNLAKCDASGALEPDAAESWDVNEDNTTFTAHIRPGLKFSDGTPVDAAAVQASFEYAQTSGSAADYEGMTFESTDPNTIALTWPEPQPVLANKICSVRIVPAAYIDAADWDVPVGSGPYELDPTKTTTGSVYTFTKVDDFWDTDRYPFESLVIKVIESDTAAVSALKTGQTDASLIDVGSIEQAESSGLSVINFQGQTPRLILSDHKGEVIPALGDVRVRRAINMVFDKQAMADKLYQGYATPTAQVFNPVSDAYIADLKDPYPYDVDAAKALMAEAGYADGFDVELPTMEGQNHETLLPYVQQQLALINIRVTEVPLSGANAIGDLLSGKYPVVLWQLGNIGNSALQIYIESTPDGWWNLEHQPDEYVDSRWAQIATATAEASKTLQQEINQYQVDQAWFAPFVLSGTTWAYDPEKLSIPTQSDQEGLTPRLRDFQLP